MTNQQHVITPPPELVEKWLWSGDCSLGRLITITSNRLQDVATQAAQWGADMELEACEKFILSTIPAGAGSRAIAEALRAARRPKPKSLKKQALERCNDYIDPDGIIRLALEALPDDN